MNENFLKVLMAEGSINADQMNAHEAMGAATEIRKALTENKIPLDRRDAALNALYAIHHRMDQLGQAVDPPISDREFVVKMAEQAEEKGFKEVGQRYRQAVINADTIEAEQKERAEKFEADNPLKKDLPQIAKVEQRRVEHRKAIKEIHKQAEESNKWWL